VATVQRHYEFTPPRNYNSSRKTPYRWLFSHIARHKLLIFLGLVLQLANITFQSIVPGIVGRMVALYNQNLLTAEIIAQNSILIFFILFSIAFIQFIRSASFETIGAKLERDARDELYSSLLGKSLTFHDSQKIGDIMSRITQDVRQLSLLMNPGVNLVFMAITFALIPIIFIGFINIQLMLTPAIFFVTFLFLAKRYNDRLTPWSLKSRETFAGIGSRLNETITGLPVVRGASREEKEEEIFKKNVQNNYEAEVSLGWARARYWPSLAFGLSLTISIYHGVYLMERNLIRIDQVVEFVLLFQLVFLAVLLNSFAISAVSMGLAASERIFEIIIGESEIDINEDGYDGEITGDIEFNNVSFGYTNSNYILKNVNLIIKPGDTVALVGVTGSGKTSLTKLLARMYDPNEGIITIDKINIKDWSIESLRKQFSLVEQDIFLFSKTIRENIVFGLNGVPDEKVIEAAKLAKANEFIESLPSGYNTIIGERGASLSGGQRQRIAIARAIIRNPKILILDDASSAIDSKTEDEINQAIRNVLKGRVSFIITHRIAQIRKADLIVLFDQGRIIDQGDHKHLFNNSDRYREIFSIFDEEEK
jgi:ATP-binding cassette, subfamily B, bacterial